MRLYVLALAVCLCLLSVGSGSNADKGDLECHHEDDESQVNINARVGVRSAAEMRSMGKADSEFRLRIIYDDSIESRPDADYIKQTYVEPAREFWVKALRIRYPLTSPILKSRSCSSSWTTVDAQNRTKTYCIGSGCAATSTCSGFVFPEKYLAKCDYCTSRNLSTCTSSGSDGEGIPDADLIIFVMSANVSSCPDAAAYSASCERENIYFRTIVSVINICPPQLYGGYDPYAMRGLLKHEIMHSLGMSRSTYGLYVDDNGNRYSPTDPATGLPPINPVTGLYQWDDDVVIQKEMPWETPAGFHLVNRTIMVLPLVRDAVRKHFNCSTLDGAELENQGGSGTQWSHLEKRIFAAENIGGTRTESQNVSIISLAIMHSTGWYNADFSAAEMYYWGQNLGCRFAQDSCYAYIRDQRAANRDPAPYCDVLSRRTVGSWWHTSCDLTRNYPTECNLRYLSSTVPAQYRYFTATVTNGQAADNPNQYGGGVEYTDYCPFLRMSILPNPTAHYNRYRRCKDPSLQLPIELDPYLEHYGPGTCVRQASPFISYFDNAGLASGNKTVTWGSGCYEIKCVSGNVSIMVRDKQLNCRRELETVAFDIATYSNVRTRGELVCPLCEHACPNSLCLMQRFNVSVLDTHDINKTVSDPPDVNYTTIVYGNSDDLMPAVIGLAVSTGVLALTTVIFSVMYFMGRKAAKAAVEPMKS